MLINLNKPNILNRSKGLTIFEYNTKTNVLSKAILKNKDIELMVDTSQDYREVKPKVTFEHLVININCCYMQNLNISGAIKTVIKEFNVTPIVK